MAYEYPRPEHLGEALNESPVSEHELTVEQLVTFGTQTPFHLPVNLIHALAALRADRDIIGRARIALAQQDGQVAVVVNVKVSGSRFSSRHACDKVYEAIEGSGTPKLLILAQVAEENPVHYRLLNVDEDGLQDADSSPTDYQPDEDEVWLLTSMYDLIEQNFERTEDVIEQWQKEEGIEFRPRFERIKLSRLLVERDVDLHGIELPGVVNRVQAQVLAQRLCKAHGGIKIYTELAFRDYFPLPSRPVVSLFEDVRDMAKRIRKANSKS